MEELQVEKRILRKYVPFDSMSDAHLNEVLSKIRVNAYAERAIVFKRGGLTKYRYFLLSGAIDLCDVDFNIHSVQEGKPESLHALNQDSNCNYTAIVTKPSSVFTVEQDFLDLVLSWDQAGNYLVMDLTADTPTMEGDWMSSLLQSQLFTRIPPANIQQLFVKFEEFQVKRGDEVITEGEEGDYFYLLRQGAAVVQRSSPENHQIILATLKSGDFFGEDALISDNPRNATITMLQSGVVMRLKKEDFKKLLQAPLLQYISEGELEKIGSEQAVKTQILDVRFPSEFMQGHHPNSINMPCNIIRSELHRLDRNNYYAIADIGGRRAELAAYLLNQNAFTVAILKS